MYRKHSLRGEKSLDTGRPLSSPSHHSFLDTQYGCEKNHFSLVIFTAACMTLIKNRHGVSHAAPHKGNQGTVWDPPPSIATLIRARMIYPLYVCSLVTYISKSSSLVFMDSRPTCPCCGASCLRICITCLRRDIKVPMEVFSVLSSDLRKPTTFVFVICTHTLVLWCRDRWFRMVFRFQNSSKCAFGRLNESIRGSRS